MPETLEEEAEQLMDVLKPHLDAIHAQGNIELAEVRAERDRYRDALEEIIKWAGHYKNEDCFNEIDDIEDIARKALEG